MADLETGLMRRLRREATGCHSWSNGPGYVYAEHSHPYEKILYCVAGSISFTLPDRTIHLRPGDRMVLPPGTVHGAVVGPEGVTCIEGRGGNMQAR
ncbi:MAG TPA: AraC family ligand binding domain-containing protein [Candidatus Dormibacteraeota bacterium]|nr:AraC family ligand binding domain-containing protein [Candidatus Dormibacteraeota bacterium]